GTLDAEAPVRRRPPGNDGGGGGDRGERPCRPRFRRRDGARPVPAADRPGDRRLPGDWRAPRQGGSLRPPGSGGCARRVDRGTSHHGGRLASARHPPAAGAGGCRVARLSQLSSGGEGAGDRNSSNLASRWPPLKYPYSSPSAMWITSPRPMCTRVPSTVNSTSPVMPTYTRSFFWDRRGGRCTPIGKTISAREPACMASGERSRTQRSENW